MLFRSGFLTPNESLLSVNGTSKRPMLDVRSFTDAGSDQAPSGPSPGLLDAEIGNSLDRVRSLQIRTLPIADQR